MCRESLKKKSFDTEESVIVIKLKWLSRILQSEAPIVPPVFPMIAITELLPTPLPPPPPFTYICIKAGWAIQVKFIIFTKFPFGLLSSVQAEQTTCYGEVQLRSSIRL